MRKAKTVLAILLIIQGALAICACSLFPQFNETGRSSTLKCIYLQTDSLILHYECRSGEAIHHLTIINNSAARRDSSMLSIKFDQPVVRYRLPILRESIVDKSIQILISVTNSHFREGYDIIIKPGDLNKYRNIYCNYSPI